MLTPNRQPGGENPFEAIATVSKKLEAQASKAPASRLAQAIGQASEGTASRLAQAQGHAPVVPLVPNIMAFERDEHVSTQSECCDLQAAFART